LNIIRAVGVCALLASGYVVPNARAATDTIENPNWEILVDEYGYSDLAYDLRPAYQWREYLSGEWAAAVSYTINSAETPPTWLNPDFIYPDWQANSDFVIESIPGASTNAYGFRVFRTVINNAALRIQITSEMLDSTNGIPQGVSPRSNPVRSCTISDRYVFRQSFQIENISGETLTGFKFFKFIHSFQASAAVYDDRDYAPALNGYHYTISQQGYDIRWVGSSLLKAVHFDTVSLHARVPPNAWEVGYYGIEGTDGHEYGSGKPSVGVHWSVEADSLSGLDSFNPGEKWVSGAMRFNLGTLTANASTNIEFLMSLRTLTAAQAGRWVAWGNNDSGQCNAPTGTICQVAAGGNHSLALRDDGKVIAWGDNSHGQTNVPGTLSNVVAISAGTNHSLALKSDGRVVAWGDNSFGQCSVPGNVTNIWAIAAGGNHSLALNNSGKAIGWGDNSHGQASVPGSLSNNVYAIAAGGNHSLALLQSGIVIGWGDDSCGQTDVPDGAQYPMAIAAGGNHSLALLYDGTVVAWGDDTYGQIDVPEGLTDIAAIAAGGNHSLALTSNNLVFAWGDDSKGQTEVPVGLGHIRVIAAGGTHSLAMIPVPPAVGISRSGSHSIISWSAAWSPKIEGTILEQASNLLIGDWAEIPSPGALDGTLYKVDLPITATHKFFRLRIP